MSYSIIPFLLIILSLSVMIVLIVRKFPQLSLLDVDTIPHVKEEKKKNEFLKKKIEERAASSFKNWRSRMRPLIAKLIDMQLRFRKYVGRVEREVLKQEGMDMRAKSAKSPKGKKRKELNALLQQADRAFQG